jgi:uncharacterized integral membrane protein
MSPRLVAGLILSGLAVLFIIQNVDVVEIRFLFWRLHMSQALLIFVVLALGIVIGWLLHSVSRHKRKVRQKQRQQLQEHQREQLHRE